MDILVVVNESPEVSTLAATALRFVEAVQRAGHTVPMVFFQGEGIYNALSAGTPDRDRPHLSAMWQKIGRQHKTRLLLCSAALARRNTGSVPGVLADEFGQAGLPFFLDFATRCDRVVTF
ncbi:MAG: sulfur relay protein TusD/DsrE [Lysobacterales bacterium]|jgi:sulfur relay protein TusD/DsrE